MQIIPVIDLKAGRVVHAKYGQREHYAPIISQLCQSADLFEVIAAYLQLANFKIFYIADLDAIAGHTDHQALLSRVLTQFSPLTFWIDSGFPLFPDPYQAFQNYYPVLGSESFNVDTYPVIKNFKKKFILSLDFHGEHFIGPEILFSAVSDWPKTVIVMTLELVGAERGPHFERLKSFKQQFQAFNIVAAGGVRCLADLFTLQSLNISAALVATALHSGSLSRDDLMTLGVSNESCKASGS